MLVKWLKKTGNGSAAATVNYMLGKDRARAGAIAIGGVARVERTAKLADSLKHKHKYAVGVLTFEEAPDQISTDAKMQIMDSFEQTIFAGLDREQYDIAWIEHRDKGRLELNFIIPKVELRSGRAMNPYLHGKDTPLIDSWKNIINNQYGLTDPNDPAKRHTTTHHQRLPKDKKELASAIDESITLAITAGTVKDRAAIIDHLGSLGLEITKTTKQSISVHHESMGARPLRLTGAYYEQDFTAGAIDQDYIEERSRAYRARAAERLRENKAEHQRLLSIRSGYNQKRYSSPAIAVSSDGRRRIRSSDQPSSRADQAADRAATAADQFADQRARSTDITAADQPASAVIHGDRSASGQDERRSDLVQDQAGSVDRTVRATAGSSQKDAGHDATRSGSAPVEHRQHDHDDQGITGQAPKNVRSGGAEIQNDGRPSWPADAAGDISRTISQRADAAAHRSDAAAHDSAAGADRQDGRQSGRIDHTQAIPAHLSPTGDDRMDHAAAAGNSVHQLQRLYEPQNSQPAGYAGTAEASNIGRSQQTDPSGQRSAAGQFGDDRADSGRHIDQVTPPSQHQDDQQERADIVARSKSIVNSDEITDHDQHPFFITLRTAFERIRSAADRTARTLFRSVRTGISAAIGAATAARNYHQHADDRDRNIDHIVAEIERRKRTAAPAHSADAADNRQSDDRDRELEQHRSASAQDDQRAAATDRIIEQSQSAINIAQYNAGRADRIAREAEQRSRERSQQIDWFDQQVQKRTKPITQQNPVHQPQPKPAPEQQQRDEKADNEYCSILCEHL